MKPLAVAHWIEDTLPRVETGKLDWAALACGAARLSLGAAIFCAPIRYRWLLFEREVPRVYGDYTNGLFFVHDAFLILALLLWGLSLVLRPRRISFGPIVLSLPLAGLALAGIISTVFSIDVLLSAYHVVRLLLAAALYLFVVNEVRHLGVIIWGVAGGLFIQASVGVAQALAQHDLGLQWLGEYELDPAWSGVSIVWGEGARSLRAYGLSDHPNILGGLLAFSLILLASWFLARNAKNRSVATGLFALGSVALLLTFSRSAWLALAAGFTLAAGLLVWTRQKEALRRGAGLTLAALIVAAPFILGNAAYLGVRLNAGGSFEAIESETRSLSERGVLNTYANQIFAAEALTGVGLGTFPLALRQVQPMLTFDYQPPHLVMLEAAAETGLFGALFFMLAALGPWFMMWLRRTRLTFGLELIGACALLLAVTLVGFFDYYPWLLAPGRFWQWLAWGLWAAMYQVSLHKA